MSNNFKETEHAMESLPIYVWVIVLIGVIGVTVTMAGVLRSGATAAGLSRHKAVRMSAAFGIAWATWGITSALLADANVYRPQPGSPIPWVAVAVTGAFTAVLLSTRLPVVRRILANPGVLWQLTLPQVWRPVGMAFLIVMALGKLPAVFALPAGLGDIAVGVEALLVARSMRRGVVGRSAMWFNIFGLLDLVVAIGIGYAAGLGPTQLLAVTPSTEAITLLPLALILTTFVPLAAALHLMSLAKLRGATRAPLVGEPVASTA
jgi:hypothetical protein